jgi:hypothetical protein
LLRSTTPQSTTQKVVCPNVIEFSKTREKALFLMAFFLNLMAVTRCVEIHTDRAAVSSTRRVGTRKW